MSPPPLTMMAASETAAALAAAAAAASSSSSPSDPGYVTMTEVNFKYLKHVIFKFFTSPDTEVRRILFSSRN